MPLLPLRSILVATDLGEGSEILVRTAAAIAARAGAELHAIHAFDLQGLPGPDAVEPPPGFPERVRQAEHRLEEQVRAAVPAGPLRVHTRVVIRTPHQAILEYARDAGVDLVVVGPHRGGATGARFLGTTADRVARTSRVPVMVVQGEPAVPFRRIGVPTDLSGPGRGALDLALAWSGALGPGPRDGPAEVRVFHVVWTVEQADDPGRTSRVLVPRLEREVAEARERVGEPVLSHVTVEVVAGENEAEAIAGHARRERLELLVMGTHGEGGVKRALLGSVAGSVARRAECPVLLVPPGLWRQAQSPGLRRTLVAVDFGGESVRAAEWTVRHFAPEAEHVLAHVVDLPQPPRFLAGSDGRRREAARSARKGARHRLEELAGSLERVRVVVDEGRPADRLRRMAADVRADVVVVGAHGEHGALRDLLGTTAERLIHRAGLPVLVVRGSPGGPPSRILAAVDDSPMAAAVLGWARFLADGSGAAVTILHSLPAVAAGYAPVYGYAGAAAPWSPEDREATRRWLEEKAAEAGLPPDRTTYEVVDGPPAREVLEAARGGAAGLVVMGSRGAGAAGRLLLGTVAGEVLRDAPCPVLVVPDPEREGTADEEP
jgi:nucleotide-binding universal stress UspA family protein